MKKLTIIFLLVASATVAHAKIANWFGEDPVLDDETKNVPFAREYVEPHCRRFFPEDTYNARMTDYDFPMRQAPGMFGNAYEGRDQELGIYVSLELSHEPPYAPIHCVVMNGDDVYYSSDIWFTMVNNHKKIYLISFAETDTTLVVYRAKDKAATAQWALLREREQ